MSNVTLALYDTANMLRSRWWVGLD